MDKQPGAMGTSAGLALRLGQAIFSVSSLLFMCFGVSFFSYSYAPFCFLVTTMGLVTPWSLGLAMIDTFLVLAKRPNQPKVLSAVILGDWVLSVLSLAVSCSTASVADYLIASHSVYCRGNICLRYQLSAAMAFLTWISSSASLLFNLWLLPTL
ncbi:CASP-like protein ARALYDRAFT_485429 [Solanum dulcamara]|uniref:CASP-like protein ARALYDRAFT_485429 n=1 Tax=Solanum dulcamara TaxID=45834 RepID=UPI002484F6DD|nr:CASP-like protein ARALYDRAFT_485429 [Solanum dulcamara]